MAKTDKNAVVVTSETALDKFQGTDLFIWGIPCDFTYDIMGKDNMDLLDEEVRLLSDCTLKFGVRTGNSHNGYTPFETPVLVIGVQASDWYIGRYATKIALAFKKRLHDIIDVAQSAYWDWCDENLA